MRLLLFITDLELGGTPTVVRELATRLRSGTSGTASEQAIEVEVACLKPAGPTGQQLRERGVDVTSLEVSSVMQLPRAVRALVKLVRAKRIDTVFSFLIHANAVAALASRRLPGVRFLQSIQTTQARPRWHWWLQRQIHRAADRVIVPSESVATRAQQRSGVPRDKLLVIPNAVDVEPFAAIRAAPPGDGPLRVGFVGRLDPVKHVDDLIDAVSQMGEAGWALDIWGDGSERQRLEARVRNASKSQPPAGPIIFHGAITDPRAAYAKIDLLVLPSEAEGFGLVLIEAMAAGVAVIGTDVDGIRDVVEHDKTGLLVPSRDPAALAAAIRRLRDDAALRSRLVANAHAEVQRRFAWPSVVEHYRRLLLRD